LIFASIASEVLKPITSVTLFEIGTRILSADEIAVLLISLSKPPISTTAIS